MNRGDKVRVSGRRGEWRLSRPLYRSSDDIAGWWVKGPKGDLHAFPLTNIRSAKKERTT